MSDDKNENLLVSTYIKRHEAVLLEHIRKQLDAEARNILLEMAINEQNKLIEDQNNTISSLQDTVEQALNGVKVNTLNRESIEKEYQDLQNKYNQLGTIAEENHNLRNTISAMQSNINELQELRNRAGLQHNIVIQLQEQNRLLTEKLAVCESSASAIKNNYNIAVKALEECEQSLPLVKKRQKKNTKNDNSEWVDGN